MRSVHDLKKNKHGFAQLAFLAGGPVGWVACAVITAAMCLSGVAISETGVLNDTDFHAEDVMKYTILGPLFSEDNGSSEISPNPDSDENSEPDIVIVLPESTTTPNKHSNSSDYAYKTVHSLRYSDTNGYQYAYAFNTVINPGVDPDIDIDDYSPDGTFSVTQYVEADWPWLVMFLIFLGSMSVCIIGYNRFFASPKVVRR